MKTLSIVAPNGSRIASGEKTLEVRRWKPKEPIRDLLIVENERVLGQDLQEEMGVAVCMVDVVGYHNWEASEIEAACARYWEEGWIAWELTNVRKIDPFPAVAKLKLYDTARP